MYFQTHAPMGLCTGWFITYVYRTAWRGVAWRGMAWLGLARRCRYSSCQTAVRGFLPAPRVYAIIARVRFQLLRRNIPATIRGIDRGSRRKICAKETESPPSFFLSLSLSLRHFLVVFCCCFYRLAGCSFAINRAAPINDFFVTFAAFQTILLFKSSVFSFTSITFENGVTDAIILLEERNSSLQSTV